MLWQTSLVTQGRKHMQDTRSRPLNHDSGLTQGGCEVRGTRRGCADARRPWVADIGAGKRRVRNREAYVLVAWRALYVVYGPKALVGRPAPLRWPHCDTSA